MRGTRALGVMLAALFFVGRAQAGSEEKLSCIDENADAQKLQRTGQLRAARDKLVACADASCPTAVRGDCASLLEQVERSLPTLSVSAKDESGADVAAVSVALDQEPFVSLAAGRAFAVDPGSHVIHAKLGTRRRDQRVVFVAGQKDRAVAFDFTEKPSPSAPPSSATEARVPTLAWIFGSVAVASGGAFVYFGLTGKSIKQRLDDSCAPTRSCSDADYSHLKTSYEAADIFAGVALGTLAVAVVTTLVWPRKKAPAVDVGFTGRSATIGGRF